MKPTREGKRFLLAILLITLAALNTGNNLIYLILSMMLSIFLLSVVMLKINMRRLALGVRQDGPIFADAPSSISLTLANAKRSGSHSIKVVSSGAFSAEAYFPLIPGHSETGQVAPVVFGRRGVYRYGDFFLESEYPFIFFRKRVAVTVRGAITVYPEIRELEGFSVQFRGEGERQDLTKSGTGEDFTMVREFRYGDDSRKISWKASAKTGKLLVMEYSSDELKRVTIILDNLMPRDADLFERAVSFSASLSSLFLGQGYFVRFMTCAKVLPFGGGTEQLYKILDVLAVLGGVNLWECPLSVEPGGLIILVLSSEDSGLIRLVPLTDMTIYAENI